MTKRASLAPKRSLKRSVWRDMSISPYYFGFGIAAACVVAIAYSGVPGQSNFKFDRSGMRFSTNRPAAPVQSLKISNSKLHGGQYGILSEGLLPENTEITNTDISGGIAAVAVKEPRK